MMVRLVRVISVLGNMITYPDLLSYIVSHMWIYMIHYWEQSVFLSLSFSFSLHIQLSACPKAVPIVNFSSDGVLLCRGLARFSTSKCDEQM